MEAEKEPKKSSLLRPGCEDQRGAVAVFTADGYLDLNALPIDAVLKQALSRDDDLFRSGCVLLGGMAGCKRAEAGVYLLGLLRYYASDLKRLEPIVEALGHFQDETCVEALFAEIRRVKSSNSTRRYLDHVIRSLSFFPGELVHSGFEDLSDDRSLSPKMRAKMRAASERIQP